MPDKVLEGCQWGSAVPRTVLAPLTGPQETVLGIYFHFDRVLSCGTLYLVYCIKEGIYAENRNYVI
jgi:hypothetical protein